MNSTRKLHNPTVVELINDHVAWLNQQPRLDLVSPADYSVRWGKRYAKIVAEHYGSVHCFVDLTTGDVLKADGWFRPASGVRYRLTDPVSIGLLRQRFDHYGSYLYASRQ